MFSILLPVDDSEANTQKAVEIVESLPGTADEVEVLVLHVNEKTKQPWIVEIESVREADEEGLIPDTLNYAVEELEDAGYAVESRWEVGDVAETIVSVADELDVDQIVMSGRKKSATQKVIFGSIAMSVLTNAKQPVTLSRNA